MFTPDKNNINNYYIGETHLIASNPDEGANILLAPSSGLTPTPAAKCPPGKSLMHSENSKAEANRVAALVFVSSVGNTETVKAFSFQYISLIKSWITWIGVTELRTTSCINNVFRLVISFQNTYEQSDSYTYSSLPILASSAAQSVGTIYPFANIPAHALLFIITQLLSFAYGRTAMKCRGDHATALAMPVQVRMRTPAIVFETNV